MIQNNVGTCGFYAGNIFYGITMIQHDADGRIVFLHRNLLKWDATQDQETVWKKIKCVETSADGKVLFGFLAQRGHYVLDLQGDVVESDFMHLFGDYELACLEILTNLRKSDLYSRFLLYDYINQHRRQ